MSYAATVPTRTPTFTVRFVLLMVLMVAVMTTPIWYGYIKLDFQEAGPQQYEDMALVTTVCPSLAGMAKDALEDGTLTKREAIRIGSEMDDLTDAYDRAVAMRPARAKLKLRQIALPPRCDNRRVAGDYTIGPILDPLWIR